MENPVAYRCTSCGHRMFPKHSRCPKCRKTEFAEVELGEGRVVTHTTLTATRPGFVKPLVLAIVDFGDDLKVLGQLEGSEPRVGTKVKPVVGRLGEKDGTPMTGFKFLPS